MNDVALLDRVTETTGQTVQGCYIPQPRRALPHGYYAAAFHNAQSSTETYDFEAVATFMAQSLEKKSHSGRHPLWLNFLSGAVLTLIPAGLITVIAGYESAGILIGLAGFTGVTVVGSIIHRHKARLDQNGTA